MEKRFSLIPLILLILVPGTICAQQIADTSYLPAIRKPAYKPGNGAVILIDEGHHNFHTATGRYAPFANLLERDGYVVKAHSGAFSQASLESGKILVISNALNALNETNWYLPVYSAFTDEEIEEVKSWVQSGGSLFLIADHMPMGGAAATLAAQFGFEFSNGFVFDTSYNGTITFSLDQGSLIKSKLVRGSRRFERVEKIVSFTGQAFRIPEDATPVLKLGEGYINLMPDTAWVFTPQTPVESAAGWYQGAYKHFGKGRVVVFGEAAMFTAQLAGPERAKAGMNNPVASENYQLLLNIIHWLDGKLN